MYRNLRAEMARSGLKQEDLAKSIGVRVATISDKMNGKNRFYYDEALTIKKSFFPDLEIEYLFENENQTA